MKFQDVVSMAGPLNSSLHTSLYLSLPDTSSPQESRKRVASRMKVLYIAILVFWVLLQVLVYEQVIVGDGPEVVFVLVE